MQKHHLDFLARRIQWDGVSSRLSLWILSNSISAAPTMSPENPPPVANPYRHDLHGPQLQVFDLDLDLNPDL